jgi:hypothetical protein
VKINAGKLLVPLVAAAVLVLTFQQTVSALKTSGTWQRVQHRKTKTEDPYARIDRVLARPGPAMPPEGVHDPFVFGEARGQHNVTVSARHASSGPPKPVAAPRPTLTSIIFDADPRATVRYDGRDFSVRENSLFADFRVRSIAANQVVLENNKGETMVLTLRPRGD